MGVGGAPAQESPYQMAGASQAESPGYAMAGAAQQAGGATKSHYAMAGPGAARSGSASNPSYAMGVGGAPAQESPYQMAGASQAESPSDHHQPGYMDVGVASPYDIADEYRGTGDNTYEELPGEKPKSHYDMATSNRAPPLPAPRPRVL